MKSPLLFAVLAAVAPLATATASDLNYNFVEFGGVVSESSAAGPSSLGDGYVGGFGAAYRFAYVAGDYADIELDSGEEVTLRSAQLGGRAQVVEVEGLKLDVNAAVSWDSFTLEDTASSDTDAGIGARIGVRAQVGERFDIGAFVGAAELDEDIDLSHYGIAAQVRMSTRLSVSFKYRYAELEDTAGETVDTDQTSISARILF